MFRKSRQREQPVEAGKDVQEKKRRFQIVKLEERIAPRHAHGRCGTIGHGEYFCHGRR